MGKKRRSDDVVESNIAAKKEKVAEFNGTVFKAMLKEPTTAMKGESTNTIRRRNIPLLSVHVVYYISVQHWRPLYP